MKAQKQTKPVSDKLIDELLEQHGRTPEDVNGLLKRLTKAVLERALQGEMTHHLGYGKHDPAGQNSGNSRNGVTRKTLKGDFGEIEHGGNIRASRRKTIQRYRASRAHAIGASPCRN